MSLKRKLLRMQAKEDEEDEEATLAEERSSGTQMELRKVRKLTVKKRILDYENNKLPKNSKSENGDEDHGDDEKEQEENESKAEEKDKDESKKDKDDEKDDDSSANPMTLEQFTDIVLASEGLSVDKKKVRPVVLEPLRKEENNNTSKKTKTSEASETANNLMQKNGDLIVEVKPVMPVKPKPVVLSPRQPPGSHLLPHHHKAKVSLSSSVVVSVKPRVYKPVSLPKQPANNGMKSHLKVEEWFSKMQPSVEELLKKSSTITSRTTATPPSSEALNLSTKPSSVLKKPPLSSSSAPPSSNHSISPKKAFSCDNSPPSHPSSLSPPPPPPPLPATAAASSLNRLSPPRLEITKVTAATSSLSSSALSLSSRQKRKDHTPTVSPFLESVVHLESVRARAIRDVQLAHTKDMHGNFPIHMSVLMRKPELVRRYCCILYVVEAPVDLLNDDKMTPLHLAIRDNSVEIIDILLAFGASPLVKDRRGNTGLHMATAAKSPDMLKMLLANLEPKELNVLNEYGLTPLHIATMNGDMASAKVLIQHGADAGMSESRNGLPTVSRAKQTKLNSIIDHLPKRSAT